MVRLVVCLQRRQLGADLFVATRTFDLGFIIRITWLWFGLSLLVGARRSNVTVLLVLQTLSVWTLLAFVCTVFVRRPSFSISNNFFYRQQKFL